MCRKLIYLTSFVLVLSLASKGWSYASNPTPADGATSVDTNVTLSWTRGFGAKLYTVYFGDNFDDVKNAAGGLPQSTPSFTPGPLEPGKTFYWRVDEFDGIESHKGEVWSFTTARANGGWTADVLLRSPEMSMPVIDGVVDDVWSFSTEQPIDVHISAYPPSGAADCSGTWRSLWDWEYLYVLVEVKDEMLYHDSTYNRSWEDDSVEVYVDGDNSKRISVDENDHQYCFRWYTQVETPRAQHHGEPSLEGVEYAVDTTSNGYLFEIRLPWVSMMGKQPTAGQLIGIDVFINDDDNGGSRDTQISWHATDGTGWNTPSMWGTALLIADKRAVYHVDANATGNNDGSSWANAYVYLQDALVDANDAQKPVEIHVAQGTYTPDCGNGYVRGDKQAKFLLKSGVTIKGGFAGVGADDPNAWDHQAYETVLSGDLSGNDERLLANFVENSDHVIWCIEGDASAVLDGFTITGGYATDRIGGGLLNYKANPTVKRCVFFDNYASQGGGMANRYSSPTVTDCTFDGNLAPYGGGGMYNTDQSHPMVESCVFHDNWTTYLGGGGMYCGDSNPTVIHCLFVDNVAPFGGGMYNAAANPFIGNCTFSNNRSNSWGGGMQNEAGSDPTVTNCILWGDIPDEIAFSGSATVTYSDVEGGWAGIGNIARDPKFADPEGRLSSGSPCIDAGNNDAVRSSITTDLDGNPRIVNGTVDMGAYEFGGTTPSPPPGSSADPLSEALDTALSFTTGGSADWFAQTTTTRYDGDAAQSGDISGNQESWMQTTVSGKGTVKFYWKVSSEEDYDFLEFYIDGSLQEKISGLEDDWERQIYTISTSGSHTLEWRYIKDGSGDSGSDCGWVDKVEWLTTP